MHLPEKKTRQKRRKSILIGSIGSLAITALLLILAGMIGGCKSKPGSNLVSEKKMFVVGTDIALKDITEFYFTRDTSTYPPDYQRYHFYIKDGKYRFYHEKRQGSHWPLTKADITASGFITLSEEQWTKLLDYLKGGQVKPRKESVQTGRSGPWLYLHWKKDRSLYQVFSFTSKQNETAFEQFCIMLKNAN